MHTPHSNDDAVTGLELITAIIVLILIGHVVLASLSGGQGTPGQSTGIIPAIAGESGYAMRHVGSVYVFPSVDGIPSDVSVRYPRQDPAQMGAAEFTVALFIGDMGGMDFKTVQVAWTNNGVTEIMPRKDTRPLDCPGWTIAGKYNMLPMQAADADDILEPNEQFEIFACPSNATAPYRQFSVFIDTPGQVLPPVVAGTAPPMAGSVVTLNPI